MQLNTGRYNRSGVIHHTDPYFTSSGISLSYAESNQISFLSNPRMFNLLMETKAGAVILPQAGVDKLPETVPFVAIVCEDPYLLYARISHHFDDSRID
ncbi:UDP-3-O-(3-hydroxymyristoyl)glucosamine N-acyltransferase [Oligella ureolytica]